MPSELELDRVSFRHPGSTRDAVHHLSLTVPAGSMVALLGSSGSGKSSALRVAAGLLTPRAGEVRLGGTSLTAVAPQHRGMAMMFQKPLLFPHLSVIDNVAFSARVAGQPRAQARAGAARFLDLVHLGELASRRSRELSGGQEQRVSLARALAATPEVLLLDEPFGALDTAVREAMYDLLGEIRAVLEPTVVLVTHDLTEASLADEVAVLSEGRLLQRGSVQALHSSPATLHVARLLGGFAELPGEVRAGIHHSPAGTLALPPGCLVPDGPATLVVHRQAVTVRPESPAHSVSVAREGHTLSGVVTKARSVGLQRRLSIALAPQARHTGDAPSIEADVPEPSAVQERVAVGDEVVVSIAGPGIWAIPEPGDRAGARPPSIVPEGQDSARTTGTA
ncbi:MAG TPA: ABC transporter ATP-binding protein [Ornithinimicrobium sp.]|uniref:ABC transporter ATP-binding protein n=1 Tax=Ornithinimicrobium sp. TaxID=1977084 RepID=UPI002B46F37C|nr:ABC transporter ATP-binding protein [Ornithinimicrobium sp.]HKJ11176.1 ABC transporter ATP-binding protein [Ornithinimicrobium sp.]